MILLPESVTLYKTVSETEWQMLSHRSYGQLGMRFLWASGAFLFSQPGHTQLVVCVSKLARDTFKVYTGWLGLETWLWGEDHVSHCQEH